MKKTLKKAQRAPRKKTKTPLPKKFLSLEGIFVEKLFKQYLTK